MSLPFPGENRFSLDRPISTDGKFPVAPVTIQSTDSSSEQKQTSPVSVSDSIASQKPPNAKPLPQRSTRASNKRPLSAEEAAADKRRRNTLAARRFRQKQQDRVAQLEQALKEVTKERDELKMQVARWEGETVALRAMLAERSKKE